MKGWFDAFRNDGGPTLYTYSNRTPVTGDINMISIVLVFSTLLVAFLVIFPGIRKERFTTFLTVVLSLFTGTVILAATNGSTWHVGVTKIVSTYRAYSSDRLHGELGAYIGLTHVNVTLKALPENNRTEDIDYNERFQWIGSHEMGTSYKQSLRKGLPFPILTVAEYLSHCQEGFNWGAHYRAAGYYAGVTLWAAFASWLMMNLLLVVVPRYGAYAMATTGSLMLLSNFLYWYLIPPNELVVRFEQSTLTFRFGNCFFVVFYSGLICVFVGTVIALVDTIFPHKFSTVLEVDYDTPYDRHTIIEDSHVTRDKKKQGGKLEEAPTAGLGNKILRRLSKRGPLDGVENEAFEMDPPKSPWRYPFRQTTVFRELNGDVQAGQGTQQQQAGTQQTTPSQQQQQQAGTQQSNKSPPGTGDAGSAPASGTPSQATLRTHLHMMRPKYPFNRQISADSQDSDHSTSSIGLSFLNKVKERPLAAQVAIHEARRNSGAGKEKKW